VVWATYYTDGVFGTHTVAPVPAAGTPIERKSEGYAMSVVEMISDSGDSTGFNFQNKELSLRHLIRALTTPRQHCEAGHEHQPLRHA
jgi:hypothetical protein